MPTHGEMKNARDAATKSVLDSGSSKRLIVAGPGTGKTFLFKCALSRCGSKGLALTFIRNLVSDLKQSLSDVADVFTFHGFCKHQLHRHAVEGLQHGWDYYPHLFPILTEDLEILGRSSLVQEELERCFHDLDDADGIVVDALALGNYYNAVSHTDLVYRALKHFEHNPGAIPSYPLIVVDEYQDFSLLETRFIELLSNRSPVLIAGDDDQALYAFKNASARYIRELFGDPDYSNFELPYCSRCPQIIVDAVNDVIRSADRNSNLSGRINKRFLCYLPDKAADSEAHPRIIHARCTVERKNAPYVGRYIAAQIGRIPAEDIRESHEKDYPTVLVIGPTPFLGLAYNEIIKTFPQATLKKSPKLMIDPLDAYRRLARDKDSRLGWRILISCIPPADGRESLCQVLRQEGDLGNAVPDAYRERHLIIADLVRRLLDDEPLNQEDETFLCKELERTFEAIKLELTSPELEESDAESEGMARDAPSIVCTSLVGAKGLSGGHVFIVGLNNKHFPRDPARVTDDEVCCFLVGLSRTRKACHLVSCGRLGNEWLSPSLFLEWIRCHLHDVRIDASYFR